VSARAGLAARWGDAGLVAAAKVLVSVAVLASGFRALSDDDYARIVIAQRFAGAPALDPSGTSWLPLPFWTTGGAMALLGRSIEVARGVSLALGVAAALLVWLSARWLGVSRWGAVAAGILGGALPYAAWLGVATVPDGPTAALMLFGAACSAQSEPRRRLLGALALAMACLSRYEAWPAAAAFAALCAWDAARERRAAHASCALAAIAAPALWMLHGAHAHGDPLFFVARVAAYRRAVSAAPVSLIESLFRYPLALVRAEPELVAITLASFGVAARTVPVAAMLTRYTRPLLVLLAMLVGLVLADLRDGAPTHHAERTLLSLWLLFAISAGDALATAWAAGDRRGRQRLTLLVTGSALVGAVGIRPFFARRDSFIDRADEVAIGRRAAALAMAPGDRLLVDTPDYGYFAVLAGHASPERAEPLDDHDPRHGRRAPGAAQNQPPNLGAELAAAHTRYLVTQRERQGAATRFGPVVAESKRFIVVEVPKAALGAP
jgi:hypothetical protein